MIQSRVAPLSLMLALMLAGLSLYAPQCPAELSDDAVLAQEAFFAIEAQPFSSDVLRKAADNIGRAYKSSPNDPWVMIAASRLFLEQGYLHGDRSRLSSYAANSIAAANDFAQRAAKYGPQESIALVQLARLQIITESDKVAWQTLNRAHELDPNSFYPWYFRAVISLQMNDTRRASDMLTEAAAQAVQPYQKAWVVERQLDVAEKLKDFKSQERYHKQLIAMAPGEPHPYGNYALFLKNQRRYDEAIEYYKKAISISPYPLAVEQLKQTLLLKEAAEKTRSGG